MKKMKYVIGTKNQYNESKKEYDSWLDIRV